MKLRLPHLMAGVAALPAMASGANLTQPNIVLIVTDQQSYNTIGALQSVYGDFPGVYFDTPNLDRLVNNGLAFTEVYCSNPVSVPSRFALFSGKYGGQYGIRENSAEDSKDEEARVRSMLATNGMGNVFTKGGYDVHYGGKVHLPFSGKSTGKFAHPTTYGFGTRYTEDERQGLGDETARLIQGIDVSKQKKPVLIVASFLNPHDICLEGSTPEGQTATSDKDNKQDVADCVNLMRSNMNDKISEVGGESNFLAQVAPPMPQNAAKTTSYPVKFKGEDGFSTARWRKYRYIYAELVHLVDEHIGTVLDAIDANPQFKENTIVVFTSDHGEMQGAHKMRAKNVPYDECQRVPLIFCGKGVNRGSNGLNASRVCNGVDLLPTLCELAGIQPPADGDGISVAKKVTGEDTTIDSTRKIYSEGDQFVCVSDGRYKYTFFDGAEKPGKNGNYYGDMLVDLSEDRGELKNIAAKQPAKTEELKASIPLSLYRRQSEYGESTLTGIESVMDNDINVCAPVEWFDLQGRKINGPAKGLCIRRQGNKVEKIVIR